MKKLIAALATSVLVLTSAVAQTLPAPTVAAKSWLLLDATSGQIIASQDPNARVEPASLTKIMTAYVTFQALKDKKLSIDQKVNVSVKAWKVDASSSKMFIDTGVAGSMNIFDELESTFHALTDTFTFWSMDSFLSFSAWKVT